jgi:glycosyltransferase involved in cell wall biosynthesis
MPHANPLTIVHAVFSSRLAGGERHCVDLAQAQAAMGHRVHVVGSSSSSALRDAVGPGVRYHGLALPLARGLRLKAIAQDVGADVCHGHLGPACRAVASVTSARRVSTLHVGYKAHQHAQMDGVICVNKGQFGLLGQYRGDAKVIYNWAPQPKADDRGDLRAELGLLPQQLLVGSLGRLNRAKGMDLLIAAFRASAPADAVLAILGEGEEMATLQRLAAGDARIRLLGYRTDVNAALQAMDLFVSASREEAFPLAILEAMRAGLPVISTATQGPLEMLANQPARIVPLGDSSAMGEAIADALSTIRQVPRHQRERIPYDVSAFDRGAAVERVIAFYRELMSRAGRRARRASPLATSPIDHA